jgi:hypothetical protein
MLASTAKLRPRYFLIVRAFAGDSTITRLVLPLTTGPFLLAAEERVDAVVARVLVLRFVAAPVLLFVPVFLVVAI